METNPFAVSVFGIDLASLATKPEFWIAAFIVIFVLGAIAALFGRNKSR